MAEGRQGGGRRGGRERLKHTAHCLYSAAFFFLLHCTFCTSFCSLLCTPVLLLLSWRLALPACPPLLFPFPPHPPHLPPSLYYSSDIIILLLCIVSLFSRHCYITCIVCCPVCVCVWLLICPVLLPVATCLPCVSIASLLFYLRPLLCNMPVVLCVYSSGCVQWCACVGHLVVVTLFLA